MPKIRGIFYYGIYCDDNYNLSVFVHFIELNPPRSGVVLLQLFQKITKKYFQGLEFEEANNK